MLTKTDAEARVAKGAVYLDGVWPDWAQHVDVLTLDMRDGCLCVLGQLEGDYGDACRKLWPRKYQLTTLLGHLMNAVEGDDQACFKAAEAFGFDAPDLGLVRRVVLAVEHLADYQLLQDAWVTQIAQRRVLAERVAEGASPALATGFPAPQ